MTILELIITTCAVQSCATSVQEANRIQLVQEKCVSELSSCVDSSEGYGLSSDQRFKICLNVRSKYGTVRPVQREPQSVPKEKPMAKEAR